MGVRLTEYDINSVMRTLGSMKRTLKFEQYNIVEELVDKGTEKGKALNNKAPRSNPEQSYVFGIKPKGNSWLGIVQGKVVLKGPSAVFEEFGTGEVGKSDPHPKVGEMSLTIPPYSGYITGPFVSTHVNKYGRHYWFYSPMGGKHTRKDGYIKRNGYTEGIPSGKQMYGTAKYLNSIKNKVAAKHLNGAIGEVNKAINDFK